MKNILFVIDSFDSNIPSDIIGKNLIKEFVKRTNVDVVSFNGESRWLDVEERNEFTIYWACNTNCQYVKHIKDVCGWTRRNYFRKLTYLVSHIPFLVKYFNTINVKRCKTEALRNAIEELDRKKHYDIVLAISHPYTTALALEKAKISGKKILYQLEPYYYSPFIKYATKIRREEINVVRNIDLILTTDYVVEQYSQTTDFAKHLDNINIVSFANVRKMEEISEKKKNDKREIVFIGTLYEDIRNPNYMLELFSKLGEEYVLHIYGRGCEDILQRYKEQLGNRLQIHGFVSIEEAENAMMEADYLINVNNSCYKLLASKVFDYISTGKPIINIIKHLDDASCKYIDRYKMAINILETETVEKGDCDKVIDFCNMYYGKTVPWKDIYIDFYDCTAEAVFDSIWSYVKKDECIMDL